MSGRPGKLCKALAIGRRWASDIATFCDESVQGAATGREAKFGALRTIGRPLSDTSLGLAVRASGGGGWAAIPAASLLRKYSHTYIPVDMDVSLL